MAIAVNMMSMRFKQVGTKPEINPVLFQNEDRPHLSSPRNVLVNLSEKRLFHPVELPTDYYMSLKRFLVYWLTLPQLGDRIARRLTVNCRNLREVRAR